VGDHGCKGISPAALERSRGSQGWNAPRVRLTVSAFASYDRRRPFKARDASALRARRASSPVQGVLYGDMQGVGRGQARRLRASGSVWSPTLLVPGSGGAGERHGVCEVGQVGVKPWRRNGRRGGRCRSPPWGVRPLGCANSAGDVSQERHHPPCGGLPPRKRGGVSAVVVVLGSSYNCRSRWTTRGPGAPVNNRLGGWT